MMYTGSLYKKWYYLYKLLLKTFMKNILLKGFFATISVVLVTSSVSAMTCTNLTKSLSRGSENSEVLKLQQFLFDGGYLTVKPNGYFGSGTVNAVRKFQVSNGLSPVGSVGPGTRGKVKSVSCENTQQPSLSSSVVVPIKSNIANSVFPQSISKYILNDVTENKNVCNKNSCSNITSAKYIYYDIKLSEFVSASSPYGKVSYYDTSIVCTRGRIKSVVDPETKEDKKNSCTVLWTVDSSKDQNFSINKISYSDTAVVKELSEKIKEDEVVKYFLSKYIPTPKKPVSTTPKAFSLSEIRAQKSLVGDAYKNAFDNCLNEALGSTRIQSLDNLYLLTSTELETFRACGRR